MEHEQIKEFNSPSVLYSLLNTGNTYTQTHDMTYYATCRIGPNFFQKRKTIQHSKLQKAC